MSRPTLAFLIAACLRDNDTLLDDRGLPTVAAVLGGKWGKHSAVYYRTRVDRMKAAIAANSNDLAAYDQLAA